MLKNKLIEINSINENVIKQDWSNTETVGTEEILFQLFKNEPLKNHNGKILKVITRDNLQDVFGLAYTSSSSYAMLSLDTNNYIYLNDKDRFSHVVIYNQDILLVTQDKEENEKYYKIKE